METGNVFTINYTAFNSHCNCTITPRFNGSLFFQTHTKTENCSTDLEIAIHRLQQSEFNTLITIPCKGAGRLLLYNVTQDSVFYITSRSANTKIDPEIFSQYLSIVFAGIPLFINFKILYIYCIMAMKIYFTRKNHISQGQRPREK